MDTPAAMELDKEITSANIVRVTIPAKVAYDREAMHQVTDSILDILGCPNCHSGKDIRFDIERRFIVDEKLNVRSLTEQFG
jgi:hypothetical protein